MACAGKRGVWAGHHRLPAFRGCCIIPHFDSGAAAGAGAWVDGNHRWRYCSANSGKRGPTKAGSMGLVSRLLCVYVEFSHLNMMVLREVIIH
jgi:hypothetical protein